MNINVTKISGKPPPLPQKNWKINPNIPKVTPKKIEKDHLIHRNYTLY